MDEADVRKNPVSKQDDIGAMGNLFVAFQLFFIFIGIAILSFLGGVLFWKGGFHFKMIVTFANFRNPVFKLRIVEYLYFTYFFGVFNH